MGAFTCSIFALIEKSFDTPDMKNFCNAGLGFAISETPNGIVVQSIADGGTAHRDGRLQIGDHILAVDDQSITGLSYESVGPVCFQYPLKPGKAFFEIFRFILPSVCSVRFLTYERDFVGAL